MGRGGKLVNGVLKSSCVTGVPFLGPFESEVGHGIVALNRQDPFHLVDQYFGLYRFPVA